MTWPLTAITVGDPGCGHINDEPHDESCAYWRGVRTGEYQPPEVGPVSLPPHADVPCLTDPALTGCECCYADGHTRRCGRTATVESNVAPFGFLPLAEECRARIFGEGS